MWVGIWDFKGEEDSSLGDGKSMQFGKQMFAMPLGEVFLMYNKVIFGDGSLLVQAPHLKSFRQLRGR